MIEIDPIVIMAMGEVFLILLIIVVVMIALAIKRSNNDKKAAKTLISRLKKDRIARDEKVRCMLNGKYHYEDGNLDISVRKFSKSERRFYQKFITAYLDRDPEKFSKLDSEFDAATDPFFNLELPSSTEGAESEGEGSISHLQQENKKLKEELGVSMKTLGRMLGEYANILDEEKQEIKKEAAEEELDTENNEEPSEIPLSPLLMEELTESADEPPTTDELLEIAEEAPLEVAEKEPNSEIVEVADEVPSIDELLEITQETPREVAEEASADDTHIESPSEESSEEPSETESLEVTEEVSADSVDDLLESIVVEGEVTETADDLPKEVLDDLEKVANDIDEMVVEDPAEAVESEVNDVDALLAEVGGAESEKEPEVVEKSKESSDPDDILDELQKAQNLGQEIENLIDIEQDLDAPLINEVDKKEN